MPAYDCSDGKLGFGATGGREDVLVEACEGRSGFCTFDVVWRGFGGGGGFVDASCDLESPEELRSAIGFLGGGGAVFTLENEATDAR